MVEYKRTIFQKEGVLQSGNLTYNVNVLVENDILSRLQVSITKTETRVSDGSNEEVPIDQSIHIGHIILENGRRVIEIVQEEDPIPHITKFQGILAELISPPAGTKAIKK